MSRLLTLLALLLPPATAAYAQPDNDDCTAFAPLLPESSLESPTFVTISTAGATKSAPDPSCTALSNDDDVFFRFIPRESRVILRYRNFVASGGSSGGLGYAIYTGCPEDEGVAEVTCDFRFGAPPDGEQLISADLQPGQIYYLRLFAQGSTTSADFELAIVRPLGNDFCHADVPTLPVAPVGGAATTTAVSTVGATQGLRTNCSATWLNDDVYYQFVAPATGVRLVYDNLVTTVGDQASGIGYTLYETCAGGELACVGTFGSGGSGQDTIAAQAPLTPENTYYLRVWLQGAGNAGTFDLGLVGVDAAATPANDDLSESFTIAQASTPIWTQASSIGAIDGLTQPCAALSGDDDIWYRFTANSRNAVLSYRNFVPSGGTSAGLGYTIYDISDGGTPIACDLSFGEEGSGSTTLDLERYLIDGNEYYLALFARGGGVSATFEFALEQDETAIVGEAPTTCEPITQTVDGSGGDPILFESPTRGLVARIPNDQNLGEVTVSLIGTAPSAAIRTFGPDEVPYLDRSLSVTSTIAPTSPVTFGFYLTGVEYRKLTDANDDARQFADYALAVRQNSSCSATYDGSGTALVPLSSSFLAGDLRSDYRLEYQLSQFGELFVVPATAPLPVTFAGVDAVAEPARNRVTWSVAAEEDLGVYVLERASAAAPSAFATVTEVAPAGLDGALATYVAYDDAPAAVSYYRVRGLDYDGTETVSAVVSVSRAGGSVARAYPNPLRGVDLTIEYPGAAEIAIADATGRVVFAGAIAPGENVVPMAQLPAGVYHAVVTAEAAVEAFRVVVE